MSMSGSIHKKMFRKVAGGRGYTKFSGNQEFNWILRKNIRLSYNQVNQWVISADGLRGQPGAHFLKFMSVYVRFMCVGFKFRESKAKKPFLQRT